MDEFESKLYFTITSEDLEYKRLDIYLAAKIPELSRTLIKKMFLENKINSESEKVKLELKCLPPFGTTISVEIPEPEPSYIQAENIPLEILYEDEFLLIINKSAGMVVHPAPGNYSGTLVNAILHHCPDLKGIGQVKRPGIVHRLDKGTSGVMVIAKEQKTHELLVDMFSRHDLVRKYEALVLGIKMQAEGTIISHIQRNPNNRLKMKAYPSKGKEAITHFKVLSTFKHTSHIECTLETGRTHQIRVHMSELLKSPILNDSVYGFAKEEKHKIKPDIKNIYKDYPHPFLHAKFLSFTHPITQKKLSFSHSPPEIFSEVLKALKNE